MASESVQCPGARGMFYVLGTQLEDMCLAMLLGTLGICACHYKSVSPPLSKSGSCEQYSEERAGQQCNIPGWGRGHMVEGRGEGGEQQAGLWDTLNRGLSRPSGQGLLGSSGLKPRGWKSGYFLEGARASSWWLTQQLEPSAVETEPAGRTLETWGSQGPDHLGSSAEDRDGQPGVASSWLGGQ